MRVSSWGRRAALRLSAAGLGLLVALGLGEIALRIGGYGRSYVNPMSSFHVPDERFGYVGKKNFSGRLRNPDFDVLIEHNAAGFRRHVRGTHAHEAPRRLFVLGDSFTWGWGVAQGKVFTDLLAGQLEGWDVRNYGLSGAGTVQQAAIFDEMVRDLVQPGDVVLLAFFANDFVDNVSGPMRGVVEEGEVSVVKPVLSRTFYWRNWLKDHCYVFNLAAYRYDLIRLHRLRRLQEERYDRMTEQTNGVAIPSDSSEYVVTRAMLERLQSGCAGRHARFVVAYVPGNTELQESADRRGINRRMQEPCREAFFRCARELELTTLDLLPCFQQAKGEGRCERITFPHDLHWNESGHIIAAETIHSFLTDEVAVATDDLRRYR